MCIRDRRSILPEEVKLPETLPVGLPSTLLERRPDVSEAEQKVIAANASVGIALSLIHIEMCIRDRYSTHLVVLVDSQHLYYKLAKLHRPMYSKEWYRENLDNLAHRNISKRPHKAGT